MPSVKSSNVYRLDVWVAFLFRLSNARASASSKSFRLKPIGFSTTRLPSPNSIGYTRLNVKWLNGISSYSLFKREPCSISAAPTCFRMKCVQSPSNDWTVAGAWAGWCCVDVIDGGSSDDDKSEICSGKACGSLSTFYCNIKRMQKYSENWIIPSLEK